MNVSGALLLATSGLGVHAAEVGVTESEIRIGQFAVQAGLAAELGKRMRNLFHVRAGYCDETECILQHLNTVGIKKIAVLYQNDSYGKAGFEGVERVLAKRNLEPAAAVTVDITAQTWRGRRLKSSRQIRRP